MRQRLIPPALVANACSVLILVIAAVGGISAQPQRGVILQDAPLLLLPDRARQPLLFMERGVEVDVIKREGEWFKVTVHGSQWGDRTGYVEAKYLRLVAALPPAELPGTPTPRPTTAASTMSGSNDGQTTARIVGLAPMFQTPDASGGPILMLDVGVIVHVLRRDGPWFNISVEGSRSGIRIGFIEEQYLEPIRSNPSPPNASRGATIPPSNAGRDNDTPNSGDRRPRRNRAAQPEQSTDLVVDAHQKQETLHGYLEWRKNDYLIVEGQRVHWTPTTQLDLGRVTNINDVPAGYEMTVTGRRAHDGSLVAQQIEAKPNGIAAYENNVVQQSDAVERIWVSDGTMFLSNGKRRHNLGQVIDKGPSVDRVRRVMNRIVPPYVDAESLRIHVVDSDEWNARAMANGAIWVNTGLLADTSDDELAVVLGHELAHYTHEHTRRSAKNDAWRQLAVVGANAAISATSSAAAQETIATVAKLSLLAWGSGYSRNLEDQADRVGLRYAHEGGYDVERAIDMWARARAKFGENDVVTNWFAGDHSRPTDRIRNIRREIQLNYQQVDRRAATAGLAPR
jgi:peptidase M48-like protein